jgi:hypothetical protein
MSVRKFVGVAGKTVESIELSLEEVPSVEIRFTDATVLDIVIAAESNVSAEWLRVKNGEQSRMRRRVFAESVRSHSAKS